MIVELITLSHEKTTALWTHLLSCLLGLSHRTSVLLLLMMIMMRSNTKGYITDRGLSWRFKASIVVLIIISIAYCQLGAFPRAMLPHVMDLLSHDPVLLPQHFNLIIVLHHFLCCLKIYS